MKRAAALVILVLSLSAACARRSSGESVTVSFFDPEWSHDTTTRKLARDAALRQFTQETGIRVNHLPAPESAPEQLAVISQLLHKGTGSPDVIGLDVIWPGILQQYLVDLKSDLSKEEESEDAELLANSTVEQHRRSLVPDGFATELWLS
jgi:trehalose/maltose transport system substrate-binding protein